jgi:hypothetical protein
MCLWMSEQFEMCVISMLRCLLFGIIITTARLLISVFFVSNSITYNSICNILQKRYGSVNVMELC